MTSTRAPGPTPTFPAPGPPSHCTADAGGSRCVGCVAAAAVIRELVDGVCNVDSAFTASRLSSAVMDRYHFETHAVRGFERRW